VELVGEIERREFADYHTPKESFGEIFLYNIYKCMREKQREAQTVLYI